mmetsp:Transcript_5792/g.15443  ORF Transcript_5792/g.15443 Transcript_5792/m.15443 type:complete len:250 (-) Transcript_5792:368-1117(-)
MEAHAMRADQQRLNWSEERRRGDHSALQVQKAHSARTSGSFIRSRSVRANGKRHASARLRARDFTMKGLERLHTAPLSEQRHLYKLSNRHAAAQDRTCHHHAMPFVRKHMVNAHHKVVTAVAAVILSSRPYPRHACLARETLIRGAQCAAQLLQLRVRCGSCGDGDDGRGCEARCMTQRGAKSCYDSIDVVTGGQKINFVERDDHAACGEENLGQREAFRCLWLNKLPCVDHEQRDVDNVRRTEHHSEQ